jgi:FAD/FMN-containing dehydrogenase
MLLGDAAAPAAISPTSNVTTVSLLLDHMSGVLAVDASKQQMRVQAGMLITKLLQEAAAAGLSVPLGSIPAFGDLTLGGVLVTGAHGTGHRATSQLVS